MCFLSCQYMWGSCMVQASCLPVHIQEPPLHVPYCPGHGAWIIQHLSLRRKGSIAVVTHMPWLCRSLMPSAQCCTPFMVMLP